MLLEKIYHLVEDPAICDGFAAAVAIERDDWYAPDALTRDAPVGTVRDHVVDSILAPCREPLHFADGIEGTLAEVVPVHADEPLLGCPEDRGLVASPAVRVRVIDFAVSKQRPVLLEDLHHDR